MDKNNAIEVKDVTKSFKVYYDKGNTLKEKILFQNRNRHEDKMVLKGISFSVRKGEAIGIIGRNGCGKSTTLKMLTKIMYPTAGSIKMQGRVSSLIELGAGFHPDMSGRENIYTNASIFGLSKKEIDERVEEIIDFSELHEFIDNPVRTYSSGMYMRLAFAVAINVDADILLIDEILAVGDVSFQEKCFERLKSIKMAGTTIVLVSHVMGQIEKICDRVIWLEEGVIREEGTPGIVGRNYLKEMEAGRRAMLQQEFDKKKQKKEEKRKQEAEEKEREKAKKKEEKQETESLLPSWGKGSPRKGSGEIRYTEAACCDATGEETLFFSPHAPMKILMKYQAGEEGISFNPVINVTRDDGTYFYGTTALSGQKKIKLYSKKEGEISLSLSHVDLPPGRYLVDIGMQSIDSSQVYDYIYNALEFRIWSEETGEAGVIHFDREWKVDSTELLKI